MYPLKNKTNEELQELLELEKQRFVRADAFRELVRSVTGSTSFPYAILDVFITLRDAIHYIDDNMIIRWVNPAALCFYSSALQREVMLEEVIGKKCFEVIGKSDICSECIVHEALKSRKVVVNRSMRAPVNGDVALDVIAIPFFNGVSGCFEIIRSKATRKGQHDNGRRNDENG